GRTNQNTSNTPPIIWTPDHGYVEPGSPRFGLHRDPKELFLQSGVDPITEDAAEEAYEAYLNLKEERLNGEHTHNNAPCIFDADSASDQAQDLYVYDDESEFDALYGTMSGGDS
ncbi:MAG: hypothetical protein KGS72_24295, partial [Cyanobacteria bacterium REEB67]|nr:hypothetical protein [Cyanobacteria bacterium REEB67]